MRLSSGAELKEWDTLYQYLNTMDVGADGLPVVAERYGQPADYLRKTEGLLANFFVSPNKAAWIQYALAAEILLVIGLIVLAVKLVKRRRRMRKNTSAL